MCFTMIFRLKNFHSAGKVPCDDVARDFPPGKFFATASQAFCHAESSLRRRRRHSATRKVLCDGVAGILPRGKFFATASQAFCHAESSLRRHRKHSATRRETFLSSFRCASYPFSFKNKPCVSIFFKLFQLHLESLLRAVRCEEFQDVEAGRDSGEIERTARGRHRAVRGDDA